MICNRNALGTSIMITKADDPEIYRLAHTNGFLGSMPFIDALSEFDLVPTIDSEGMPDMVVMDIGDEAVNLLIPDNALRIVHGTEKALEIFSELTTGNKQFKADPFICPEEQFLKVYKEYDVSYKEAKKLMKSEGKKDNKEKPGSNKPLVYRLKSMRDVLNYLQSAKAIYKYNGRYYLEAKEGVMLDDFLVRASEKVLSEGIMLDI